MEHHLFLQRPDDVIPYVCSCFYAYTLNESMVFQSKYKLTAMRAVAAPNSKRKPETFSL